MSTALKTPTVVAISQEGLRYGIAAILLGVCFIGVTGFAHPGSASRGSSQHAAFA